VDQINKKENRKHDFIMDAVSVTLLVYEKTVLYCTDIPIYNTMTCDG